MGGVDPRTGHERWRIARLLGSRFQHDDTFAYFTRPVGVPGARRPELWRVDLRTGEVSSVPSAQPALGTFTLVHQAGVLVFHAASGSVSDPGLTTAVDAATGRVLWGRAGRPSETATAAGVLIDPGRSSPEPLAKLVNVRTGGVLFELPPTFGSVIGYRHDWLLRGEDHAGGGILVGVNPDNSVRWRSEVLRWPRETWDTPGTVVVASCRKRYFYCSTRELVAVAVG